jgi:hypothetical protein
VRVVSAGERSSFLILPSVSTTDIAGLESLPR